MHRLLSRIMLAIAASCFAITVYANPLQVTLSTGAHPGSVHVNLTNTGSKPLSILKWDTPFEETLSDDVFRITRKKGPLSEYLNATYTGPVVKRAASDANNYLAIKSSETISAEVSLSQYYQIQNVATLDVQFAGDIRYTELGAFKRTQLPAKDSLATLSSATLQSNSIPVALAPLATPRILTPRYNNCSAQETADILAAANVAEQLVNTAMTDLNSLALSERASSPRYATWFGAYTAARYDRVVSNFTSIERALSEETIRFDCGCDRDGVFAYVYPSRHYTVYLCPAFRAADIDGTDSRAGTIIHELSHFSVLADTDDHVYSQRGAQELATSDPDTAIDNADTHEYFTENTPALGISGTANTSTAIEHAVLALGESVTATANENEAVSYQLSNVNRVELTSSTGDADLYVYSDSSHLAEICQSRHPAGTVDVCEQLGNSGTVYVSVYAYSDTTYTLQADAAGSTSTPGTADTATSLALSTPVSGTMSLDEQSLYRVSGATSIELESTTGDLDLFVYDSADLTNLVCASVLPGEQIDRCNIPSGGGDHYVLVTVYTDSQFVLTATGEESAAPSETEVDQGRIVIGQTSSATIEEGVMHRYLVNGASSVQINSLAGDADLGVFTGLLSDVQTTSTCISDHFSSESTIDQCDIQTTGDAYVYVFGFSDANYTIVASNGSNTTVDNPADDDPIVPVVNDPATPIPQTDNTVAASSGGGALSLFWLASLILVNGARRIHKRRATR